MLILSVLVGGVVVVSLVFRGWFCVGVVLVVVVVGFLGFGCSSGSGVAICGVAFVCCWLWCCWMSVGIAGAAVVAWRGPLECCCGCWWLMFVVVGKLAVGVAWEVVVGLAVVVGKLAVGVVCRGM